MGKGGGKNLYGGTWILLNQKLEKKEKRHTPLINNRTTTIPGVLTQRLGKQNTHILYNINKY